MSTGEDGPLESSQVQSTEILGVLHSGLTASIDTSQVQSVTATGDSFYPTVTGTLSTSQVQTVSIDTTEIAPGITAVIVTTQVQSSELEGNVIPEEVPPPVVVPPKPTGSGVYHGPYGIPINTDYLNAPTQVSEAEIPYTDFATFFGHNDGGELEKFLEVDKKPEVIEDTSMSFLKNLPPPKFNRSMDFIKSLSSPSPQIIAETEADITGEPAPKLEPVAVTESVVPATTKPKVLKEKIKPVKKDSFDLLWESTRQTGQMLQQAGQLLEAAVDPKRTEPVNIDDLTKAIAIVEDNIQKLKSKLPIL